MAHWSREGGRTGAGCRARLTHAARACDFQGPGQVREVEVGLRNREKPHYGAAVRPELQDGHDL
jgi:hypothetical protein